MKPLFSPAIGLMNRLNYSRKISLIAIIFLIPVVLTMSLLWSQMSIEIDFAEKERLGVAYIEPVRQLMQHMPEHRGMTNAFLHGADFKAKILAKREQITADIAAIDAVDTEFGEILGTTQQWIAIKATWQKLQGEAFNLSAEESFSRHTAMIAEVLALVVHVGDTSNLILDPALDSLYLMNSVVNTLPQVTESMGRLRGAASGVAARQRIEMAERVKLIMLASIIQSNLDATNRGLHTAFSENGKLKGSLNSLLEESNRLTDKFLMEVDERVAEAEEIDIDSGHVFAMGSAAIVANYRLFDAIIPELDRLLVARSAAASSKRLLLTSIVVAVLLVAGFLFVGFYHGVIDAISAIKEAAKRMSEGDLNVHVKSHSKDECGQVAAVFNEMAQQFRIIIEQVGAATAHLVASTGEMSQVTSETSSGVRAQQQQTDQVAAAINEMAATVHEVAKNASEAAEAANSADAEAHSGKQVVSQTMASIDSLASDVERAADVIHALEKDSESIGSVLDVIKGIAEQTNLLALNAAIEAARAGEQGRGFAVVADEVRTLASRTQESTTEIQGMIERLQSGTGEAVKVMSESRDRAQESVKQAAQADESLTSITSAVSTIKAMNDQIASAAEEQGAVSEEINRSVVQISQVADQTSEGAEKLAASGSQLAALADQLQGLVARFKV